MCLCVHVTKSARRDVAVPFVPKWPLTKIWFFRYSLSKCEKTVQDIAITATGKWIWAFQKLHSLPSFGGWKTMRCKSTSIYFCARRCCKPPSGESIPLRLPLLCLLLWSEKETNCGRRPQSDLSSSVHTYTSFYSRLSCDLWNNVKGVLCLETSACYSTLL